MDFPELTIILVTYKRPKEIRQTIDALLKHVIYPREKMRWLIADDHSGGGYLDKLLSEKRYGTLNLEVCETPANCGWGCNVNQALRFAGTELVFQIEDDYVLRQELDLRAGVALLETKPHIGMLRYRGTAGDHVILHQMEADIAAYCPDYQEGVGLQGKLTYCLIDSGSPTLYIYSHGAHLKRRAFHAFYGEYPEGLKLGRTEESYAHTVKKLMKQPDAPAIGILPSWIPLHFDHIGESRQLTALDKGE